MTAKRKLTKDFGKLTLVLYGITYSVNSLSEAMQSNCKLHGLCQKLIDCTAGMNSKDYTDDERKAKVAEVWTTLKSGQWTKPGEGTTGITKKVLEAKLAEKDEMLAGMNLKLDEAMKLIEKLTKKA